MIIISVLLTVIRNTAIVLLQSESLAVAGPKDQSGINDQTDTYLEIGRKSRGEKSPLDAMTSLSRR